MADSWLFDVRTRLRRDGTAVVLVVGEVDLATVESFRAALMPLSTNPQVRLVACDLSLVSFFGCDGVSALLRARSELETRGARLRIDAASRVVRRTLSVTGVSDLMSTA